MRFFARPILPMVAAFVAVGAAQTAARADYIWATVENGQVRFALLENANAAPNPDYDKYVTGLTSQCDGKSLTMGVAKGGARFAPLAANQTVVTGESIVGVRERGGETYLLVYDAKGAASLKAAETNTKAPAEVSAHKEGDKLEVSVFQSGKPVPQSEVWVQWPGEEDATSVKTDDKGEVLVPWPATPRPGFISIRAKVNETKAGEAEGKKYPLIRRWATLTFPVQGSTTAAEKPFTQIMRASYGVNHEVVANAEFNKTLFEGKLTKAQLEVHLQQRALVHNEVHRILSTAEAAGKSLPYGPEQKNVLVLLFTDLVAMGSGWPTEPQARPLTKAFLQEIRDSEAKGPYFAMGIHHVYYGGITNGGRMIGAKIGETTKFTPSYYEKSDGYMAYLTEVNKISDPEARKEMIRGAQEAYKYIIASSNEDVFKAK
jgi:hypothetical protein